MNVLSPLLKTTRQAGHDGDDQVASTRLQSSCDGLYLNALTWAFTFFNSIRVFAYLPTLWAIHSSGDSGPYSVWTWVTWAGANATMAAWLYEHNGRRLNRTVVVNMCNAGMCVATLVVIAIYRP